MGARGRGGAGRGKQAYKLRQAEGTSRGRGVFLFSVPPGSMSQEPQRVGEERNGARLGNTSEVGAPGSCSECLQ